MRKIIEFFIKEKNNLEQNLKEYEQKEKTKQQESKIHGQKPVKRENSKEKRTSLHHS
jgi:hypothetical protein